MPYGYAATRSSHLDTLLDGSHAHVLAHHYAPVLPCGLPALLRPKHATLRVPTHIGMLADDTALILPCCRAGPACPQRLGAAPSAALTGRAGYSDRSGGPGS